MRVERMEKRGRVTRKIWVLRVDLRTLGYLVREELQRELLRERAGLRADMRRS